ncbi:MAG TPA: hypothetical protein VFS05_13170 [Gemmatimonadaceae bacterium]|nr:hypothetical protein [Gemmatimonadaceae bacterium]
MHARRGEEPRPAAEGDPLGRLVETEQRLGETLAQANDEAARLLAEARAAAEGEEAALEGELRRAIAELDERFERDVSLEIVEIAERAKRRAAWYDRLGEQRIAELARQMIERITAADQRRAEATRAAGGDRR